MTGFRSDMVRYNFPEIWPGYGLYGINYTGTLEFLKLENSDSRNQSKTNQVINMADAEIEKILEPYRLAVKVSF